MPTYKSNDFFLYFTLNLKERTTAASKTITITNRYLPDLSSPTEYYPILQTISGLGSELGDFLPRAISGNITLDVSASSFGYQRRLIDIFQRYAPGEQDVTIYYKLVEPGAMTAISGGTAIATTTVKAWSADIQSETLTLRTSETTIPAKSIGYVVTADRHATAPRSTLNKTLPLVFGSDQQVKGYNDGDDGYLCATALGGQEGFSGAQFGYNATKLEEVFIRDSKERDYVSIDLGDFVNVNTATFDNSASTHGSAIEVGTNSSGAYTPPRRGIGWTLSTLDSSLADNRVITKLSIRMNGAGATNGDGHNLSIGFKRINPTTGLPEDNSLIDFFQVDGATYETEIEGTTPYWVDFHPPKPILLRDDIDTVLLLYHVFPESRSASEGTWEASVHNTGSSTIKFWTLGEPDFWFESTTANAPGLKVWTMASEFDTGLSGTNTDKGFREVQITMNQAIGWAAQTKPDLNNFDLIASIGGLRDDSSGTITGTAFTDLDRPDYIAKLLTLEYDGTDWGIGTIFQGTYSSDIEAAYSSGLVMNGRTSGRANIKRELASLMYSSACRLGMRDEGLAIFQHGQPQTIKGRITDRHARIVSIEESEVARTLVTFYPVNYQRRLTDIEVVDATNELNLRGFANYEEFGADTLGELIGNAEDIYGRRELGDITPQYVSTATSVRELVDIYASLYGRNPTWFVTFEVPFIEFTDLDLFDVYTLVHPQMPAFFGTASRANAVTHDQAVVTLANEGKKRAEPYRIQIESKRLNVLQGEAPVLRVKARVILDTIDPT